MSTSFPIKADLPKEAQAELDRINAISSAQRSSTETAFLNARLQYLTNEIVETDSAGNILRCRGNTVPTDGLSGFAKGAIFIDLDVATGIEGTYENIGTITSCKFITVGSRGSAGYRVDQGQSYFFDLSSSVHYIKYDNTGSLDGVMLNGFGGVALGVGGTQKVILKSTSIQFNYDAIRVTTPKTPASAAATGTQGDIAWDANYIYVCVAANTWKRVAIATW